MKGVIHNCLMICDICQASARVYIARHLLHMLDDSSNLKYAKLGVF